jgi:O-methyltransferase involved in polyketide biosynthesis
VAAERDFSTISPSARWILMARAQTDLPYAHDAAVRLFGAEMVADSARKIAADGGARIRVMHFEQRSRSIDDALAARDARCVLELAAGLSFRGLAMCARPEVCYVDTDLPDTAATKRELVAALAPAGVAGEYRVESLDAMDERAFAAVVAAMPAGPVTIVNEGLLMYLDRAEKVRLCTAIAAQLRARGGAWVTADIYVRSDHTLSRDAATKEFLVRHDVDANKFGSYDEATELFEACGLVVAERSVCVGADGLRQTWVLTARSA